MYEHQSWPFYLILFYFIFPLHSTYSGNYYFNPWWGKEDDSVHSHLNSYMHLEKFSNNVSGNRRSAWKLSDGIPIAVVWSAGQLTSGCAKSSLLYRSIQQGPHSSASHGRGRSQPLKKQEIKSNSIIRDWTIDFKNILHRYDQVRNALWSSDTGGGQRLLSVF